MSTAMSRTPVSRSHGSGKTLPAEYGNWPCSESINHGFLVPDDRRLRMLPYRDTPRILARELANLPLNKLWIFRWLVCLHQRAKNVAHLFPNCVCLSLTVQVNPKSHCSIWFFQYLMANRLWVQKPLWGDVTNTCSFRSSSLSLYFSAFLSQLVLCTPVSTSYSIIHSALAMVFL